MLTRTYGKIQTFERIASWTFFIGLAAAIAALITLERPRHHRAEPAPPPAETIVVESYAEAKSDKLTVTETAVDAPKTVRTVPVSPLFRPDAVEPRFEPTPMPVVSQTEFPSLPQPKVSKPDAKGDVCARHGMRRETYDKGRRWRCVK